jgi:hypothetical protein
VTFSSAWSPSPPLHVIRFIIVAWLEVLVLNAKVGRSDVLPAPAVGSRVAIPAAGLGFGRCAQPRPLREWQVPWVQLIGIDYGIAGHNTLITQQDGVWWVTDSGAVWGTLLNGQRIARHVLEDGDVISIAQDGATLRFHHGLEP